MTFDGLNYQVPNTGAFWLVNSLASGTQIQGLFGPCYAQSASSCLQGVTVYQQGASQYYTVYYHAGQTNNMEATIGTRSGGQLYAQTPSYAADGSASFVIGPSYTGSATVSVKTGPLGLSVIVQSAASQVNSTRGLCGNFNGCIDDDIMPQNDVSSANQFVDLHRVPSSQVLFDMAREIVPTANIGLSSKSSLMTEFGVLNGQSCTGIDGPL